MAFELIFRFTGLCAFVSKNGQMYSMLVNAREHPHGFAVYTAALLVPQGNLHPESERTPTELNVRSKT